MNARGIPVFYGAMDKSTCIAEVRPPVGGYTVLAKYELIHPVQLLDCDALTAVYTECSYFNPKYSEYKAHAAFFKWLAGEISRPVMPQDEQVEYILTQALAEYLAIKAKIKFDGMIFNSSQTGGDGRNLVLFNHASGIKPSDNEREEMELDIRIHRYNEDDEELYGSISIFEYPKAPNEGESLSERRDGRQDTPFAVLDAFDGEGVNNFTRSPEPTLRLDLESLEVHSVESVQYCTKLLDVERYSLTDEDFTQWSGVVEK